MRFLTWLTDNWLLVSAILSTLTVILSTIATRLSNYPDPAKMTKAVWVLRTICDVLSVMPHKDSTGVGGGTVLNLPGVRSTPPRHLPHRLDIDAALHALPLLVGLAFLTGCTPASIDNARRSLTATERFETAVMLQIQTSNVVKQQEIIDEGVKSGDLAGMKVKLADYRAKRDKMVTVVLDVVAVTAAGHTIIPLVESGVKSESDLNVWIAQAADALLRLREALSQFGVPLPAGL